MIASGRLSAGATPDLFGDIPVFPFDKIKIDRSLVKDLAQRRD